MKTRVSLLLLSLFLFLRCEREEVAVPAPRTPESLMAWYETRYPSPLRFQVEGESVGSAMTPRWASARVAGNSSLLSLEADLHSDGFPLQVPAGREAADAPSVRSASSAPVVSFTRLIVLSNEELAEQLCFLMVVVPTADYCALYPDFSADFSYFDRPPAYDGRVLYFNMEGVFVNGWEYVSGCVTERITSAAGPDSRSSDCALSSLSVYENFCWTIQVGEGSNASRKTECEFRLAYQIETRICQIAADPRPIGSYDNDVWSGGGGGGGRTDNNPPKNKSRLEKLAPHLSLNAADSKKLEKALEELAAECAFEQLLNYLADSGFQLQDVRIDPELGGNAGFSSKNELKFANGDEISVENLMHELTHAYQSDYHRRNGTGYKVGGAETGAMEFEVRLLADLIAFQKDTNVMRNGWACRVYGNGFYKAEENYKQWLKSLLGTKNTFPDSIDMVEFNTFDKKFRESHTFYRQYQEGVAYKSTLPALFETINSNCLK